MKMMIAVAEWWWLPQTTSVYIINCSFAWLHLCAQSSANRCCKINLYNGSSSSRKSGNWTNKWKLTLKHFLNKNHSPANRPILADSMEIFVWKIGSSFFHLICLLIFSYSFYFLTRSTLIIPIKMPHLFWLLLRWEKKNDVHIHSATHFKLDLQLQEICMVLP